MGQGPRGPRGRMPGDAPLQGGTLAPVHREPKPPRSEPFQPPFHSKLGIRGTQATTLKSKIANFLLTPPALARRSWSAGFFPCDGFAQQGMMKASEWESPISLQVTRCHFWSNA